MRKRDMQLEKNDMFALLLASMWAMLPILIIGIGIVALAILIMF